jgi:hypothetical protein
MLTRRRAADVLKELNNKDLNISGDEDDNINSEDNGIRNFLTRNIRMMRLTVLM